MTSRARRLCGLVAALGLVAVVVLLVKPVRASFEDDPLLRLQAFDRPVAALPTEVDCGSVLTSLRSTSSAAGLYAMARDEACHDEGYRRFVAAIAAGIVVIVLVSMIVVVANPPEQRPPRVRVRATRPRTPALKGPLGPPAPPPTPEPSAAKERDIDAGPPNLQATPDEPGADDADDAEPELEEVSPAGEGR